MTFISTLSTLAGGVVVEAEEVAGAEAAEVDRSCRTRVLSAARVGAAEAAGDEDGVERVAFFEREDDGVFGEGGGGGSGELA